MKSYIPFFIVFLVGGLLASGISYLIHLQYAEGVNREASISIMAFSQETMLTNQKENMATLKLLSEQEYDVLKLIYESQACTFLIANPVVDKQDSLYEITVQTKQYFEEFYPKENKCGLE